MIANHFLNGIFTPQWSLLCVSPWHCITLVHCWHRQQQPRCHLLEGQTLRWATVTGIWCERAVPSGHIIHYHPKRGTRYSLQYSIVYYYSSIAKLLGLLGHSTYGFHHVSSCFIHIDHIDCNIPQTYMEHLSPDLQKSFEPQLRYAPLCSASLLRCHLPPLAALRRWSPTLRHLQVL